VASGASKRSSGESDAAAAQTATSLLSSARDLAFVLAIFAFFAGFEYRYYYYHYLGIPAATFSLVDAQMLAGSYSVFYSHLWYLIIVFAAILAVMLGLGYIPVARERSLNYQRLALLLLLLACFPVLNYWAQQTAGLVFESLVAGQTPRKPIIVSLIHGPEQPLIESAMKSGCVELITQSSDTLYVLVRQKAYPHFFVEAIPTQAVAHWITPLDERGATYAKRCTSD
jgi:hypothetical protein